jgi:hypothetical protein
MLWLKKQQNNTKTKKKALILNLNDYQLKTANGFLHKELQNLTIFTSNGQVSYLEAGVILSLIKSVPAPLLPHLASFKSKLNINKMT